MIRILKSLYEAREEVDRLKAVIAVEHRVRIMKLEKQIVSLKKNQVKENRELDGHALLPGAKEDDVDCEGASQRHKDCEDSNLASELLAKVEKEILMHTYVTYLCKTVKRIAK